MPRHRTEAAEQQIGQDKPITLPYTGDVGEIDRSVEPMREMPSKQKLDAEAFMEEILDVVVSESTDDKNPEPIVFTSVNGIPQYFVRGQTQSVKRKYVEVLARAKRTGISTPEVRDRDGNLTTQIRKHTALQYPFSVMHDPNPAGPAWLRSVLAQG